MVKRVFRLLRSGLFLILAAAVIFACADIPEEGESEARSDDVSASARTTFLINGYDCASDKSKLIILCALDSNADSLRGVAIPCEAKVESGTVADIYKNGGIESVISYVKNAFGVSVDYYINVSNTAFYAVVDEIGGFDLHGKHYDSQAARSALEVADSEEHLKVVGNALKTLKKECDLATMLRLSGKLWDEVDTDIGTAQLIKFITACKKIDLSRSKVISLIKSPDGSLNEHDCRNTVRYYLG